MKIVATIISLWGLLFSTQFPRHTVKFYDDQSFKSAVAKASVKTINLKYRIVGGIVPHHLFVSDFIADFFQRLSAQNPKRLIILGPNHYESGDYLALSSLYNWQTNDGVIKVDTSSVQELISYHVVKIDEEVLINDHAISGLLPFVKYYLPDVKIIPILLKKTYSQTQINTLADTLNNLMDEDTVVIASIDFSHYLTRAQAKINDTKTLKLINKFDIQQISILNSDYVDSPSSLAVLLTVMQKRGTTNFDLLFHSNSGELQNNSVIPTTSYIEGFYY